MSKAATELLLELGANVYAIDINKIDLPVTKAFQADMSQKEEIDRVINLPTWEDAMDWYDKHPDLIKSAYVFAKQCLESYVTYKCMSSEFINKRIRINAINPGDTTTGLTEDFNKSTSPNGDAKEGEEMISNIFLKSWNGYPAEPKDMGYPMVVIGSDICSYM